MGAFRDLAGMTFGRITAVSVAGRNRHNQIEWNTLGALRDSPSVIRGILAYAERHRQLRAV